jgi:hypothetical protein
MLDQRTKAAPDSEASRAHVKADDISKRVPGVAALYRSVGAKCYLDKEYEDPSVDRLTGWATTGRPSWETVERKHELDQMLFDLTYNEIANETKDSAFRDGATELAQNYVNHSWLHTRWLTSRILLQILDSELAPLQKEISGYYVPGRLTSLLPGAYGVVVPMLLFSMALIIEMFIAAILFANNHPIWGSLITGIIVWHLAGRATLNSKMRRHREKMRDLSHQLSLIRQEVASGNYDPGEIDRRIRRSEEKGLCVHSLSHALIATMTAHIQGAG